MIVMMKYHFLLSFTNCLRAFSSFLIMLMYGFFKHAVIT